MWREESFMLHLMRSAVTPWLRLRECVENWSEISHDLREPPRKRELHIARLASPASPLS